MNLEKLSRKSALGLLARLSRTRPLPVEALRKEALESILVVRQDDRIGNLLFITPLLTGLHRMKPGARIEVVSSSRFPEILAHHPAVDGQILVDRRELRRPPQGLWRGLRALRRRSYDLIIDCKPEPSLSNVAAVLLTRGRRRIGFEHEYSRRLYHATYREPETRTHESERLYGLLSVLGTPPPCPPMSFHFPPDRGPGSRGSVVSIHIGGRGGKRIPGTVLEALLDALEREGLAVVILAGPEEEERSRQLSGRFPGADVRRPPDVVELARLIGESRVFLGPDTGALHIASALDVPTANLVGRDVSHVYGPRSRLRTVIRFGDPDAVGRVLEFVRSVPSPVGSPESTPPLSS